MTTVNIPSDPEQRAAVMRRRAAAWAAGAAEAEAFDRERVAGLTMDERLAEGVELTRIAEQLRASAHPRQKR